MLLKGKRHGTKCKKTIIEREETGMDLDDDTLAIVSQGVSERERASELPVLEGGAGELVVASGLFVNELGEASERDCVRSGARPDDGDVKKGKRKPKRKLKSSALG